MLKQKQVTIRLQIKIMTHCWSDLNAEREQVEQERIAVEESQAKIDLEQEAIDKAQAALDASTAESRAELERLTACVSQVREHMSGGARAIKAIEATAELVKEYLDKRASHGPVVEAMNKGESELLPELRQQVSDKKHEVQTLTATVIESTDRISFLKKALDDIEGRLPELQKAKKLAVDGRNFKVRLSLRDS